MLTAEADLSAQAAVFAALGDPTRLRLMGRLTMGCPLSISTLTTGLGLTRQAVAKHLQVLQAAGLVQSRKAGREQHFSARPEALAAAEAYLQGVSRHWDSALDRLRTHVERQG